MNLHVDIPTRAQIDRLLTSRDDASVSLYLPTDPASSGEAERIGLGNLAGEALRQLVEAGAPADARAALEELLLELPDDDDLWRYLGRSLAVFATPTGVVTFRLPNRLVELVEVSDRFHLKPLLRAVTFPQVAYVLALAQGGVRLVEVGAELGASEVDVPDLPKDAATAAGKASLADRSPAGRVQGDEGRKLRLRQYARHVDAALRPVLGASGVPLVLAAAEPLDGIFRSVCSYPHLAEEGVAGSPERLSAAELAAAARPVLDAVHRQELDALQARFRERGSQGRTATDVVDVARAATFGAVDTVVVDMDEVVPGTVDDAGVVTFEEGADAVSYGVVDEIARRSWLAGGRVLAVRREDVPGGGSVAAILRYPLS